MYSLDYQVELILLYRYISKTKTETELVFLERENVCVLYSRVKLFLVKNISSGETLPK